MEVKKFSNHCKRTRYTYRYRANVFDILYYDPRDNTRTWCDMINYLINYIINSSLILHGYGECRFNFSKSDDVNVTSTDEARVLPNY